MDDDMKAARAAGPRFRPPNEVVQAALVAIYNTKHSYHKAQKEFVAAEDRLAALKLRLQWATASADMRRQEYDLAGLANMLMTETGGVEVEDAYLELKHAAVKLEDIVAEIARAQERLGMAELYLDRTAQAIADAQIEHDRLALEQLASDAPILTDLQKRLIQIGRVASSDSHQEVNFGKPGPASPVGPAGPAGPAWWERLPIRGSVPDDLPR